MVDKRIPNWIAEPLVPDELIPAPEWLVYGMLPESGLGVLYGHPGSLKTFEIIALMMCLYTGTSFCGQRTKQCIPFYIAADPDPDTPRARAQAWRIHYESGLKGVDFSNLAMFRTAVNLHRQEEVEAAAKAIKAQGIKPRIVIFDTLFHSSIGADLKEPDEMLAILDRARWLMAEVGARTGIIVHHTPKDGKTMFGTQALLASVDWVWRSDAIDTTSATLTCERMKSARAFASIKLTFHSMKLRMAPNSWGDEWVEQLVLDLNVQPAPEASKKAEGQEELDELMWVTALNLSRPPERLIQYTAWFELTKAKRGGKLGNDTFSKAVKRLCDSEAVRKVGDFYQVVLDGAGSADGTPETGVGSAPPAPTPAPPAPPLRGEE
jgi:AAA domain